MKTYTLKPQDIERRWWLVDAAEQPLGRLASRIAQILRGKHKPTFTPHVNGGDFVIVINAEKVHLSGRKIEQKRYFRHTGYMGHERFTPVQKVLGKHPEHFLDRREPLVTHVAGVPEVALLLDLATRQVHFLGVDDDD